LLSQSPQQELENLHSTKPPFVPDLEEKATRKKASKQINSKKSSFHTSLHHQKEMK
jgi:hypothetical protein